MRQKPPTIVHVFFREMHQALELKLILCDWGCPRNSRCEWAALRQNGFHKFDNIVVRYPIQLGLLAECYIDACLPVHPASDDFLHAEFVQAAGA